jgi:hypothetical protein
MAKYKLISDGTIETITDEQGNIVKRQFKITGIQDTENGYFIPLDPNNRHYQEYQEWLKEGNTPDDPFTLDEYKQRVKAKIKTGFLNQFNLGYECSLGFKVDCKKEDLLNLQGAYQLAVNTNQTEVTIRDYDNQLHTISVDDLKTIIDELLQYHAHLFQQKWTLEQQVDNATTFDELFDIDWTPPTTS